MNVSKLELSSISKAEAERAVLAAILLEPAMAVGLVKQKGLTPEAFVSSHNAIIFRTMEAMSSSGKAIDILTVMRRLEDKGNIDKVGGREYMMGLLDAIPTVAHLEHYVDEVIESYRLRSLLGCIDKIPDMIADNASSSEIVSKVTADIVKNIDLGQQDDPAKLHAQSLDEFQKAKDGVRPGLTSFLEPFNEIIGSYLPSNVYVVAGRPSDGKSCFAYNELINLAISQGVPCAFASLEMSSKLLREMMAGSIANVSVYGARGGSFSETQLESLSSAFDEILNAPLHINDTRMTIDETIAWVSYMSSRYHIKAFFLDYLQLIKPSRYGNRNSRNEEVQEWSAAIKDMTKRLGLITVLISQLSRAGIRLQDKTPPPPTLEALRDSGCIEQDADAVIMLYKRPGMNAQEYFSDADWKMEMSVEKHRVGPTGVRPYAFVRRRQRIESELQYENRMTHENSPIRFDTIDYIQK